MGRKKKKTLDLGTYMDEPMDLKVLVGNLCDHLKIKIIEVTDEWDNLLYYDFEPVDQEVPDETKP